MEENVTEADVTFVFRDQNTILPSPALGEQQEEMKV